MTTPANKTCTICNTETVGQYCQHCGQRNTGKKLKLLTVINDLMSNLFSLEKSGLATALILIRNPTDVIESYWNGYRKYHEPPSKLIVYAALVIGVHIIVNDNLIFGLSFSDSPQGFFLVFFLVMLTISSYLTYLRRKRSFLEHTVANIYLLGLWTVIMIIFYEAVTYFTEIDVRFFSLIALITLMIIWTGRTFCKRKSWLVIVLSAVLQLVVFIAQFALLALLLYLLFGLEISL